MLNYVKSTILICTAKMKRMQGEEITGNANFVHKLHTEKRNTTSSHNNRTLYDPVFG